MKRSPIINFELLQQMFDDELYQSLKDEIDKLLDDEITLYERMRLELMLTGIFVAQTNFKQALFYNLSALKLADDLGELYYVALAESNCISIFSRLNEPEQSIYYGKKALGNYLKIDDREKLGLTYSKLGTVYETFNDLDEARICFEKALLYCEYLEDKQHVTVVLNLAVLKVYAKEYDSVLHIATRYIPKVDEMNNFRLLSFIYRLKGIAHYGLGQFYEAKSAFEFVEPFHVYLKNYFEQMEWYKHLLSMAKEQDKPEHIEKLKHKIDKLKIKQKESTT